MAAKNNIRSIRFSDDLTELIDRQQGDTFTRKFENLITQCVWELPAKEAELERLETRIKEERQNLRKLVQQINELDDTINSLLPKVLDLEATVGRALEKWNT